VLLVTGLAGATREIRIIVDDEVMVLAATPALTVGDVLKQAGVELRDSDKVTPQVSERVRGRSVITVTRAVPIELTVDGSKVALRSTGPMVKHVLAESGILLRPEDKVNPGMEAGLTPGMSIKVTRVTSEVVVRQVRVPYRTEEKPDSGMDRGEAEVIRRGVEGLREEKVRVTYEDGRVVNETVLSSKVLREAVSKVVKVGTRNPVRTLLTSRGTFRYREVKTMTATAYEPGPTSCGKWADGYTAIGLKAVPGIAAVDPKVIPLRTKLYVEGYGPAIAGDVGGAIKGNRIDLLFETVEEALRYGRRKVKVYILEP
jgi:3D (Asp-Asp-Asp) domain-containing protein